MSVKNYNKFWRRAKPGAVMLNKDTGIVIGVVHGAWTDNKTLLVDYIDSKGSIKPNNIPSILHRHNIIHTQNIIYKKQKEEIEQKYILWKLGQLS